MNKSIIVIDKPSKCVDCVCYVICSLEHCILYGEELKINSKPIKKICRLKSLPQKKDIHEKIYQAYGLGKDETYEHMRNAVDKVLDEILGGNDE